MAEIRRRAPKGSGTITAKGFRLLTIGGRQQYEHRLIYEKYRGQVPEGMCIYHKNGDKLDNRIDNLELKPVGRPSNAPDGYGYIRPDGYRIITIDGCHQYEHRVVWEKSNGPIPEGKEIHHRNEDKLDNRIENLELVDSHIHRRAYHSGRFFKDGVELKTCRNCGEDKPVDQFYMWRTGRRTGTLFSTCKLCDNQYQREKRKVSQKAANQLGVLE